MPDFFDNMYEHGFDDPQDYMDYLESRTSESLSEYDSEDIVSNNEGDVPRDDFKSRIDWPRLVLLKQRYLSWKNTDPLGRIIEEYFVKYNDKERMCVEQLSYVDEFATDPDEAETDIRAYYYGEQLKSLEDWEKWLSLSAKNKDRFLTERTQSQKRMVDELLRTYSICDCFDDFFMSSWMEINLFDHYHFLGEWIKDHPDYFQNILQSLSTSIDSLDKEYSKSRFIEAVIWKSHIKDVDNSAYSLFKCLEDDDNRHWDECFGSFIERNECSEKVFQAWERTHKTEWEEFYSCDEAKQIRKRIQEEEDNKTFEEKMDEDAMASILYLCGGPCEKDPDAPFNVFVDSERWRYNHINGKDEEAVFKLWRSRNQEEWMKWSEVYLWNENMGGYKKRFLSRQTIDKKNLPIHLYWLNELTISVFNTWVSTHTSQWEEYINSINYQHHKEAIINTIAVHIYLKKCKDKLDKDSIALSIGDHLSSYYDKWSLIEKMRLQDEKERSLKMFDEMDRFSGRREYWNVWFFDEYDNYPDKSFESILQEWYRANSDEDLKDYYDMCIYLNWFTELANNGKIDSSFAFENKAGFY